MSLACPLLIVVRLLSSVGRSEPRSGAHLYGPSAAGVTIMYVTLPGDPEVTMPAITPAVARTITLTLSVSSRLRFRAVAAFRHPPSSATAQLCHIARFAGPVDRLLRSRHGRGRAGDPVRTFRG